MATSRPPGKRNGASPMLIAFGKAFRRHRVATGLSQERLAVKLGVTTQYVSLVELGRTRCTYDFATAADDALETSGEIQELWKDLVMDAAYPTWFDWPTIESDAVEITAYGLTVVPGLLQTPAYAAAILHDDKEAVDARLKRQEILRRDDPPALTVLLDEAVLRRETGDKEVMREQLEYLLSVAGPTVTIQIIPNRGEHSGNSGPFVVATLADRSEVVYVESAYRGLTLSEPDALARIAKTLLELRSLALPMSASLELIRRTVEELWT
ncbi:helix-turn-helix domain-containing protein [Actinomadura chibensis]|uniref:Helix-turn-helix domain-containing protein n=1 Tax=Actinomadura chibensis TaxID=392828 RepID=A0A5D0NYK3_9ACTN|nr:helix-turn-helix transcriptional regulator [Actinomadura chibensis]TYB49556.1 helix-turn-helix domain-containing protein [Actinomadura chibensis]